MKNRFVILAFLALVQGSTSASTSTVVATEFLTCQNSMMLTDFTGDMRSVCNRPMESESACEREVTEYQPIGQEDFGISGAKTLTRLVSEVMKNAQNPKFQENCSTPCKRTNLKKRQVLKIRPANANYQEQIPGSSSDPQQCTQKHLNQTYVVNHIISQTCAIEKQSGCRTQLQETASNWVKNVMTDDVVVTAKEVSSRKNVRKTFLQMCPDPCAYYSVQHYEFQRTGNQEEILVRIDMSCSTPRAGFLPKFTVQAGYEVNYSCKE